MHFPIFYWLFLSLFVSTAAVSISNVCSMVEKGEQPNNVLVSQVPAKGKEAGIYTESKENDGNITDCISACCANEKCNVVFVYKAEHCLLISCNTYESCAPVSSTDERHTKSLFLWVREPKTTTTASNIESTSEKPAIKNLTFGKSCGSSVGLCSDGLVCASKGPERVCQCTPGQYWDGELKKCKILAISPKPVVMKKIEQKSCDQGLNNCPANEHCVITEKHKKRGYCDCLEGLKRDDTGSCIDKTELTTATIENVREALSTIAAMRFEELVIGIKGPTQVQLPIKNVEFKAKITTNYENDDLMYQWSLSPEKGSSNEEKEPIGTSDSWGKQDLILRNLKPGDYILKITVKGTKYRGVASQKLKVLAEEKPNIGPKAVIGPETSIVTSEGKKVVLDATGSSDPDGEIVAYQWSQASGNSVEMPPDRLSKTLSFDSLKPGNYTFILTVFDAQGAKDQAEAHVQILEQRDDKPKAVAGLCGKEPGDAKVQLPLKAVHLCGNMSYDDHVIKSYSWTKTSSKPAVLPVDMTGTSRPVLTLQQLQAGTFEFELTVTDNKGQTDKTQVSLIVLKEENRGPIANAGGRNQTVILPETEITLDGSQSTDDGGVATFYWTKLQGPAGEKILYPNKAKTTVTDLGEGVYKFQLNVTDDKRLFAVDSIYVYVVRSKNNPPKIVIDDEVSVSMPCNLAVLNGSRSYDDAGITKWSWAPVEDNLAFLTILGSSKNEPALLLSNLYPGTYHFKLIILDHQKANDTRTVTLKVDEDPNINQTVELYLDTSLSRFTIKEREKFRNLIELLLHANIDGNKAESTIKIIFLNIGEDASSGRVRLLFYAQETKSKSVIDGSKVVEVIDSHLKIFSSFNVSSVVTKYCRNECSGHGTCNHFTKKCQCEAYWMPNLFAYYVLAKKSNCEWSVLYFVLISLLLLSTVGGTLWAMICSMRTGRVCSQAKRRKKYRMLANSVAGKKQISFKKNGKAGQQMSSLLISSESGSDSDLEDTLFENSVKNRANNTLTTTNPEA